ncbi:MAG: hypothetical protein J1F69_03345 [Clostridiales bacterium]|nr:hypothetical protein [Clostridiales bacterium]
MNTSQTQMIEKCRADLKRESIIKSVLCGMIIGLSVTFLIAFITWFFVETNGLWIALGVGLGLWAISAPLLYFFKFIPNDMTVMRRLDRAGLDERMITMYELQGDTSYMATRQRNDAEQAFDTALKASGGKIVKVKIATAMICVASIVGGLALAMSVVTGLSDYGVIPSVNQMISGDGAGAGGREYTVEFMVSAQGGGTINGVEKVTQKVRAGGSSSVRVKPAADENGLMYYLDKWVDGDGNEYYTNSPVFVVNNVRKSMVFTAVFESEPVDDEAGLGYYFDPDGKGDDQMQQPGDNPSDGDNPMPGGDNKPAPPQNAPGGGNPTEANNTIIDGETPYDAEYDYYYQLAMEMLANGTEGYPPELVEMLEAYFGILK